LRSATATPHRAPPPIPPWPWWHAHSPTPPPHTRHAALDADADILRTTTSPPHVWIYELTLLTTPAGPSLFLLQPSTTHLPVWFVMSSVSLSLCLSLHLLVCLPGRPAASSLASVGGAGRLGVVVCGGEERERRRLGRGEE
jgi:hypothetical protein